MQLLYTCPAVTAALFVAYGLYKLRPPLCRSSVSISADEFTFAHCERSSFQSTYPENACPVKPLHGMRFLDTWTERRTFRCKCELVSGSYTRETLLGDVGVLLNRRRQGNTVSFEASACTELSTEYHVLIITHWCSRRIRW